MEQTEPLIEPQSYLFPLGFLDGNPTLTRALFLLTVAAGCLFAIVNLREISLFVTDENRYVTGKTGVDIVNIVSGGASDRAGLRVGDVIVAVNGHEVRTAEQAMVYLLKGYAGKRITYTILRGGERLDVELTLALLGLQMNFIAFTITGILLLSVAIFVYMRRPRNRLARLFGWSVFCAAMLVLLAMGSYPTSFISRIRPLVVSLCWARGLGLMYHLFLLFPARRFSRPFPKSYLALVHLLPFGFLALAIMMEKFHLPVMLYSAAVLTPLGIIIFEVVNRRLFKEKNPEYGKKARPFAIAGVLFFVMFLGAMLVRDSEQWNVAFFAFLAVPALLFYAVIQNRLFDLYVVIRKNSLYLILSVVWVMFVASAGTTAVLMLPGLLRTIPVVRLSTTAIEVISLDMFSADQQAQIERRLLVFGILGAFALWKLYAQGKKYLNAKFHRGSYDYKLALQEFGTLSRSYSDRISLAVNVVRELSDIMHLKGAIFLHRHNGAFDALAMDGFLNTRTENLTQVISTSAAWAPLLDAEMGSQAVENLGLKHMFRDTGVEFITPVAVEDSIEAFLLLGEKHSETNYTREDVELLDTMATNVGEALQTMNFYEGTKEQERLRKEFEIARQIQLSSLPTDIPVFPGLDVAAASQPAYEVGGDFFDYLTRHDSATFIIGDVSGKGTSAALYLARIQGIVRTIHSYQPSPWELFARLNNLIFDHLEKNVYLTLSAVHVDFLTRKVIHLRAGHLPLVHYRAATDEVLLHQPSGIGIGLDHALFSEHLEEEGIDPTAGDVFVLCTDGIVEAANEADEEFSIGRVAEILKACHLQSAEEIKTRILADVDAFMGACERCDDATIVVIKFE